MNEEAMESAIPPLITPSKFLVCVNKSEESLVALRFACIKAKKRGGLVDIVHVMEPADIQPLFGVADRMREERRDEAEALMKRMAGMAYEISGIAVGLVLREGQIGDEIIAAAIEDNDANILVLGVAPQSSNRGKLISWLAGHLGDQLLIPLLLVPGNLTDQQIDQLS